MPTRFLLICLLILQIPLAAANTDAPANRLLQLVDYVGVDYAGAVENGQVADAGEYAEMQEFAERIHQGLQALSPTDGLDELRQTGARLSDAVAAKAPASEVATLSAELSSGLIRLYDLVLPPRHTPDIKAAAGLYAQNCATCHGVQGQGDGPLANSLTPAPTDFHELARHDQRSVFALYNVISQGVEGTAMTAFTDLNDEQRWALAYYVAQLGIPAERLAEGETAVTGETLPSELKTPEALAATTPAQVRQHYGASTVAAFEYLRAHPETVYTSPAGDALALARSLLADSLEAFHAGDRAAAQRLAVQSYLDGFEPLEAQLDVVDSDLRHATEGAMTAYRSALRNAGAEAVQSRYDAALGQLDTVEQALGGNGLSATASFAGSFIILVREGLEALLVVAAIAAFLIKTGKREGLRYVHAGWLGALALGGVTWWISRNLISIGGAERELTEGFAALVAAGMLFYVGFWMHSKSQAQRWRQFIEGSVQRALGRSTLWGLAGLSFLAVYREAFETVLFYESLWAQSGPQGGLPILGGLLSGTVVLALLAWLVLRAGHRLPLRQFFSWSAVFLLVLAIVFAGKGVAALQEAGKIPVNALDFVPRIELLGVYPNAETLGVQLLMLGLGLWLLRRNSASPARAAH